MKAFLTLVRVESSWHDARSRKFLRFLTGEKLLRSLDGRSNIIHCGIEIDRQTNMPQPKFIPTPAGTLVPAPTAVQSFARRQVFARAPCTNDSFVGGKECQFTFRASGTDCLVCDQTRLVMKLHVRPNVSDIHESPNHLLGGRAAA